MTVQFMVTQAGLEALVDAQAGTTEPILVTQVGLTALDFVMAPTITVLPGEFKRLSAVSGQAVSETVIHMTAQDHSADIYELRGICLYLDDGTLFAVYSQADPLFRKVSVAFFLLALDIAFANGTAGDISFGDTTFLLPPASETVKGVMEIATAIEVADGMDDERAVTPLKLKDRLGYVLSDEFERRTISGAGLVTGGGTLLADSRTLTVTAATGAEVAAGTNTDHAITPASLSAGLALLGGWDLSVPLFRITGTPIIVQMGQYRALITTENSVTIAFPQAFPNGVLYVGPIPYISADDYERDLFVQMRDRDATGFTVYFQAPDAAGNRLDGFDWLAVGY